MRHKIAPGGGSTAGDSFPVLKSRSPSGSLVPRLRVSSPSGSLVPRPKFSKWQTEPRPPTPNYPASLYIRAGVSTFFFRRGTRHLYRNIIFLPCCCTKPGLCLHANCTRPAYRCTEPVIMKAQILHVAAQSLQLQCTGLAYPAYCCTGPVFQLHGNYVPDAQGLHSSCTGPAF